VSGELYPLDPDGRHVWRPIATIADIRIEFSEPRLSWTGAGYIDMNYGTVPLEQDFQFWNWSRGRSSRGAYIFYDTVLKSGLTRHISLAFDASGRATPVAPLPAVDLPSASIWRMPRAARSEASAPPRVLETLEDTPFYSRSLIEQRCAGERIRAIHESVSLERFGKPFVKAMLPFRMPRRP
jgi:carotenoid 1,2-hydratase